MVMLANRLNEIVSEMNCRKEAMLTESYNKAA